MNATVPTIAALYAALLGLLGAALTINVIVNRVRAKVDFADGGVATLAQAIRAHANFAEQAPIALILIGLAEVLGTRPVIVHVFGIVLVLARLASAIGLNRTLKNSPPRQICSRSPASGDGDARPLRTAWFALVSGWWRNFFLRHTLRPNLRSRWG